MKKSGKYPNRVTNGYLQATTKKFLEKGFPYCSEWNGKEVIATMSVTPIRKITEMLVRNPGFFPFSPQIGMNTYEWVLENGHHEDAEYLEEALREKITNPNGDVIFLSFSAEYMLRVTHILYVNADNLHWPYQESIEELMQRHNIKAQLTKDEIIKELNEYKDYDKF